MLKAVTCIDLTTLSGDDTEANTSRLTLKAARPIRKDLLQVKENCSSKYLKNMSYLQAMDMLDANITTGAVCVYPSRVKECVEFLKRLI